MQFDWHNTGFEPERAVGAFGLELVVTAQRRGPQATRRPIPPRLHQAATEDDDGRMPRQLGHAAKECDDVTSCFAGRANGEAAALALALSAK